MEAWRDIPGYGDHYQASSLGRIRVKDRVVVKRYTDGRVVKQFYKGRLLNPSKLDKWGHLALHLSVDNIKFSVGVHRLVLAAFVGPCPDGMEACHNNGDAADNRPENLRWDTHRNNNLDRKMHGRYFCGEQHHSSKLTAAQVEDIRASPLSLRLVANKYGIGKTQASRIRRGLAWPLSA